MATIGQQLPQPEAGWKRYDDRDNSISYDTSRFYLHASPNQYLGASTCSDKTNAIIRFNFKGRNLRIISNLIGPISATNIVVKIDGFVQGSFSIRGVGDLHPMPLFEKKELAGKEHYVEIIGDDSVYGRGVTNCLDAIDIDITGELKPYNENPASVKHLIKSSDKIHISSEEKDSLVYPNLTEPLTQANYEKWGMDDLMGYENEIDKVLIEMDESGVLEDGRVVRKVVNKNEFKINRIEVK